MSSPEDTNLTDEDKLVHKHREEKKKLQAEIQKLKHAVPKGDKKKKKEVNDAVSCMEAELEERHKRELEQFNCDELSERVEELSTDDAKGGAVGGSEEASQYSATPAEEENLPDSSNDRSKPSKAQRRRDKKAAAERERQTEIEEQSISNLTGPRHVETQKIKSILASRDLVVVEIPSDGNCLYAAIDDQLRQQGCTEKSVEVLRRLTAEHMRSHSDDFLPFLCNQETGDMYTDEEFEAYCVELETSPVWGGQLEIQALSVVLDCPIEVIQADSPPIVSGEGAANTNITITYHHHIYNLGAHYNSVKPKPTDDEEENLS